HTSFQSPQIRGGVFTADGGLFSLAGPVRVATGQLKSPAALTHPSATLTSFSSLDLGVTDTFSIETGASIDVSGKGYLGAGDGANTSTVGQGGGNLPGSGVDAGGSHGGLGGISNQPAPGQPGATYDSIENPVEPGGGGGATFRSGPGGGTGGGVVHVAASSLVLNGTILANGTSGQYTGGAGGSVRLDVGTLSGAGSLHADGGTGSPLAGNLSNYKGGSGGGGRVAIYGDVSAFNLAKAIASGGN